jgi:hypothetical protein
VFYYSTRTPGAGVASCLTTLNFSVRGQVGYEFAAAGSLHACEMASRGGGGS